MAWQDQEYQRFNEPSGPDFTYISWVNPGAGLPNPGFFLALDQEADVTIPGENVSRLQRDGSETPGVYASALDLACIAHRFRWERGNGHGKEYATGKYPGGGWRGRTQVLALVRNPEGMPVGPVVLTFSGWAGSFFREAMDAHAEAVEAALHACGADENTPPWIFCGRYTFCGEVEMVGNGQKSAVARATYDARLLEDLNATWIGQDAADRIQAMADQVKSWRDAWNGNGHHAGDNPAASLGPERTADFAADQSPESPAAATQWGQIRKLMRTLGYGDVARQDAVIAEKGYDPDALTQAEAGEIIRKLEQALQAFNAAVGP